MIITAPKYRRLCIVSILPLLLLGFLSANFFLPYDRLLVVLCEPSPFSESENCRDVGELNGNFYKSVEKDFNAWFDVPSFWKKGASITNLIEVSSRTLADAEIVRAGPFSRYSSNTARFMKNLVGRRAIVQLGIEGGKRSVVDEERISLYCNDLRFEDTPGVYQSVCFGDGWTGAVTYSVAGPSKKMLDQLESSINEQINHKKADYLIYRIVMYPILIYAFLVISVLAWMAAKAIRYVKEG